jgi:hypothetical protein
MGDEPSWRDRAVGSVLGATRISQAMVVEAVDQAACLAPSWLIPSGLVGRATPLVDDGYGLSLQLITLQREFAQRLAEAVEHEDHPARGSRTRRGADVVDLAEARRRSSHG